MEIHARQETGSKSGLITRMALSVLLGGLVIAPMPVLAADEIPLPIAPGDAGLVMRFAMQGELGESGLLVASSPTMLLLEGIRPDSPASLADIPNPKYARVRIAAVEGKAVETLTEAQLRGAFFPKNPHVRVTFARKFERALNETLVGPVTLPLTSAARHVQLAMWLSAHGKHAEAYAAMPAGSPEGNQLSERTLLDAHLAAAAGDYAAAQALVTLIPPNDSLAPDAARLRTFIYERRSADLLSQADRAAAAGDFKLAFTALASVPNTGSFGVLRRLREADWRRAIAALPAVRREAQLAREARAERMRQEAATRQNEAARKAQEAEAKREEERRRNAGRPRIKL